MALDEIEMWITVKVSLEAMEWFLVSVIIIASPIYFDCVHGGWKTAVNKVRDQQRAN